MVVDLTGAVVDPVQVLLQDVDVGPLIGEEAVEGPGGQSSWCQYSVFHENTRTAPGGGGPPGAIKAAGLEAAVDGAQGAAIPPPQRRPAAAPQCGQESDRDGQVQGGRDHVGDQPQPEPAGEQVVQDHETQPAGRRDPGRLPQRAGSGVRASTAAPEGGGRQPLEGAGSDAREDGEADHEVDGDEARRRRAGTCGRTRTGTCRASPSAHAASDTAGSAAHQGPSRNGAGRVTTASAAARDARRRAGVSLALGEAALPRIEGDAQAAALEQLAQQGREFAVVAHPARARRA